MEDNKIIDTQSMKMEKVEGNENYSDSHKFIKLDSKAAAEISGVLHYIPSIAAGEALSGAYRVVFPKGISGTLVPHNGGFLATLRDTETKKYLAQGTLFSLSEAGAMMSVFSALSIATSQYYLHQINEQLTQIQDKLNEVLDFLYTDKACELYAETRLIHGFYQNCVAIMHCSEQRIAALQSVQRARALAERNIQFYYRDMKKLAAKKDAFDGLMDDLNNYTQAVSLYGVCVVMEIVLSENYDPSYLKYVEADLKKHVEKHHEEVGQLKGMIIAMPKPAPAPPFFQAPKPDPRKEELLQNIEKVLGKDSPVRGFTEIIAQMNAEYSNKSEYRILSDGTVYKCVQTT